MRSATPITIRRSVPADVAFLRELAHEAFSEYDGDGERAAARVIAMAAHTHALVAESSSRLGFVLVSVERGAAHISAIAVVRSERGRGIGTRLLAAAETLARDRGARFVDLETGEANLAALDMFLSAGYRIEGRIARYYRTGYDALTLRHKLD